MPRKRSEGQRRGDTGSLWQRIALLAQLLWHGNKSRMAKALGISHPVLSRVLRGLQEPPGKLLEALARWPGLNVRWLFVGEGEPLSERTLGAGGGRFLPIADRLLPGEPKAHPELLTWTSFPVAEAWFSETAYWFRVPAGHPIVKPKAGVDRLKEGDYLLFETAAAWTKRVEVVRERLCALQVPGPGGEVILGKVARDEQILPLPEYYPIDTFDVHPDVRLLAHEEAPDESEKRVIFMRLEHVAGVCVKLDRIP